MSLLQFDFLPRNPQELLVGICVRLKEQHIIVFQVPEGQVQAFLHKYYSGGLVGKELYGVSLGDITHWSFQGSDIVAMHTLASQSMGQARRLGGNATGFGPAVGNNHFSG
jgi:hypothetical protein